MTIAAKMTSAIAQGAGPLGLGAAARNGRLAGAARGSASSVAEATLAHAGIVSISAPCFA